MCSSKLSGVSSSTFDANAQPTDKNVAKTVSENRMVMVVERKEGGGHYTPRKSAYIQVREPNRSPPITT